MSYLNLGIKVLIAEDQSHTNPNIRTPDITLDIQKVPVSRPKTDEIVLQPGDSEMIATTVRSIAADNTTEFEISRPWSNADIIRLTWTGVGTAPGFRTKRALGVDATTQITFTRVAPNTVRIAASAGTAINSAAVLVGDTFKLEQSTESLTSPFSPTNTNLYLKVQSKGTGYIDVLDNGSLILDTDILLGADFDQLMSVFSPGSVRIGDTVQISGPSVNVGNAGKFTVLNLSHDYIEFLNPLAVAETFQNSSSVVVFDRLIGFLMVRSRNCPEGFSIRIDGGSAFKLTPIAGEAVFVGSIVAHTIEAVNDGSQTVVIPLAHATVMG